MAKGIVAESTTDYFSLLERANDQCDADHINHMNQYIDDSITLANSFISAMDAALKEDDGGQDGINGIVARRLFTVWFGIEFGGALGEDPAPTAGTMAIWEAMQTAFDAVHNVLDTETFVGPGLTNDKPFLSCTGEFAQKYSWGDQAYNTDGYLIPGNSIADFWDEDDTKAPWWIDEVSMYIFNTAQAEDNMCDEYVDGKGKLIQMYAYSMQGDDEGVRKTNTGQLIYTANKKPGLLMCPVTFERDIDILDDVEWKDPSGKTQISQMYPLGSITMFHELFHLSTYWLETTNADGDPEYNTNPTYIRDVTYDPFECLQLAQDNAAQTVTNAQTYAFFAFSYWYFEQNWGGNTPATFYPGYLVVWNDLFG